MRILVLDRFLGGRDGPGIYIHEMARGLLARGHRVAIAYGKVAGEHLPDGIERYSVPRLHLLRRGDGPAREALARALAEFRPDVASAQCLDVLWFAEQVEAVCPLVATLHTHALTCPNWNRLFADGTLCARDVGPACLAHTVVDGCGSRNPLHVLGAADRIVRARAAIPHLTAIQAVNGYMRGTLERAGIPARQLFDLGYPAPFFDETRRYTPPTRKLVLFVGRLDATKGPDQLLEAFARLPEDAELAFVGGGPLEAPLRERARRLGLEGRCHFYVGPEALVTRGELSQLYLDASVACVPSVWADPAPLVRLEAMAHGRPVVGYDSGGVGSCIEEGKTGFLVARYDTAALARRLTQLLEDPVLHRNMGEAALAAVHRDYHPAKVAEATEGIYERLVRSRA